MNRRTSLYNARHHHGLVLAIVLAIVLGTLLVAESAFGLGFRLTQIGGTAINGRGVIGDTVTVAVDFTIDEGEVMLGVGATLWWDQAGGNVIDVVSATEEGSATLGGFAFNRINSRYLLFENNIPPFTNVREFENGNDFGDTQAGTNYLVGLESLHPIVADNAQLTQLIDNGAPGPGTIRMGEVTFRLSGLGSTTIGFFFDPDSTLRSLVLGPRGFTYSGDQIEFVDIPVSAIGLDSLNIVVVPEPSTALMVGFGLVALGTRRRRS